jgi:hypothetical protein
MPDDHEPSGPIDYLSLPGTLPGARVGGDDQRIGLARDQGQTGEAALACVGAALAVVAEVVVAAEEVCELLGLVEGGRGVDEAVVVLEFFFFFFFFF